jgi:DNA primase
MAESTHEENNMLDFEVIKKIPVADVATGQYHLQLAHKGDYATCTCPLPTHKQGDRSRCFSINLKGNYWRCFSQSCNANNGGKKGGDVINFVALMEGCGPKDAAERLSGWYGVGKKETPQRMAEGSSGTVHQKINPDSSTSSDSVKYMQGIDAWFDELFKRREKEVDVDYWKRARNGVKAKLIESFRNGKRQAQGLPPQ